MSAPLSLVRLRPDRDALVRWAIRLGYLPAGADPGYAVHAALKASLGDLAPQPFVLRETRDQLELLGYSKVSAQDLQAAAALPTVHDPQAAFALGTSRLEARDMPEVWRAGASFSFEVRIRPVVRTRSDPVAKSKGPRRHVEIDAAFIARPNAEDLTDHETIYGQWLSERLGAQGARASATRLVARRQVRLLHRPRTETGRRPILIPGPEALFRGDLEVTDPHLFSEGIKRGIGRHRAFGFGMLLLAPPGVL